MKKNYLMPAIKAQTIALQNMIAESPGSGIGGGMEEGEENVVKENILDGLFE